MRLSLSLSFPPLPVSNSSLPDRSADEKSYVCPEQEQKRNAPSPGNKLAVKALPPSSSEELPDVEKEREEAAVGAAAEEVVVRSDRVEDADDASVGASGALETAADAALFRPPKSAFIAVMLVGAGGRF